MKTNALVSAILMAGVLITSCKKENSNVIPSEKITISTLSVTGVKSIDVSDRFQVYVSFSETDESAFIEANENLHSLIRVEQYGDQLVVTLKENTDFNGVPVLTLHLNTASLYEVVAEGDTEVEFANQLVNNQFELELTGSSQFTGAVETGNFVANIEGASILELVGSADSFQIDARGACDMTGFDFTTNKLEAYLEGGCKTSLTVMQKLDVDASGASKVYYKGNGIIEHQNLTGGSEIIKID